MFITYKKGELARLKVSLRAVELGYTVSVPMVEARYDLVLDDGKRFYRVQVKYADCRDSRCSESIRIDLRKECRNNGKKKLYTRSEIDVVIAYVPATDKCYWFGPELFDGLKYIIFRLTPTKSGRLKRIRYAEDFEFGQLTQLAE